MLNASDQTRLLKAAREAAGRAYAPYSGLRVGAAVLTAQGRIYTGCNVENASYGLTLCAERAALAAAVNGEGGDNLQLRALAVVCEPAGPCAPCGACRQVIQEFGPQTAILFYGREGLLVRQIEELLPEAFALVASAENSSL